MAREKIKFALRIAPETQQLVKDLCARDNCQSQNEFIEKAIRFYAGYVSSGEAIDYLPPALVAALRGTVEDSEHRIARLLFKLAVETSMMMNVLAAGMEISEEDPPAASRQMCPGGQADQRQYLPQGRSEIPKGAGIGGD